MTRQRALILDIMREKMCIRDSGIIEDADPVA